MTVITPAPNPAAPGPESGDFFNDPVVLRYLKIAVVVMAVILILGFIAIVARIFYLSSRLPAQPPQSAATGSSVAGARATLPDRMRLELPRDAAIRSMSLSGDRLAVHFEGPAGPGIAILDLETGRTLSRVEIAPPPGR